MPLPERQPPDPDVLTQYDDVPGTNMLFVGRIAPNKRQEDVIRVFRYYKEHIDTHARLFLVGTYAGFERYQAQLQSYVERHQIPDVVFTGLVSDAELFAYYKLSDVFVCLSEHEGFCVPLLESMYFDVPIIAYDAGAIRETLDGSGVLVQKKKYDVVAEVAAQLVRNEPLRRRTLAGQRKRLADFADDRLLPLFKRHIEAVIE